MKLIGEVFGAMFGAPKLLDRGAVSESLEEAAWREYHSSWEMDPPPEPREVFLAGYRAGREQQR